MTSPKVINLDMAALYHFLYTIQWGIDFLSWSFELELERGIDFCLVD